MVLAEDAGLDTQEFRQLFESDQLKQAALENFRYSQRLGITGFPTILAMEKEGNKHNLALISAGYQPYEIIKPVIGIDEYKEYNDLQYAVRDAESIQAILQEHYNFPEENIIVKVNENATKNEITEGFYSLAERTQPNDAVVIFFAGHGETRTIGIENKDLGYLIQ